MIYNEWTKKKILAIMMMALLAFGLTACGGSNSDSANENTEEQETTVQLPESDILVVYFSQTGHTKGVAEKIASITDAIPRFISDIRFGGERNHVSWTLS